MSAVKLYVGPSLRLDSNTLAFLDSIGCSLRYDSKSQFEGAYTLVRDRDVARVARKAPSATKILPLSYVDKCRELGRRVDPIAFLTGNLAPLTPQKPVTAPAPSPLVVPLVTSVLPKPVRTPVPVSSPAIRFVAPSCRRVSLPGVTVFGRAYASSTPNNTTSSNGAAASAVARSEANPPAPSSSSSSQAQDEAAGSQLLSEKPTPLPREANPMPLPREANPMPLPSEANPMPLPSEANPMPDHPSLNEEDEDPTAGHQSPSHGTATEGDDGDDDAGDNDAVTVIVDRDDPSGEDDRSTDEDVSESEGEETAVVVLSSSVTQPHQEPSTTADAQHELQLSRRVKRPRPESSIRGEVLDEETTERPKRPPLPLEDPPTPATDRQSLTQPSMEIPPNQASFFPTLSSTGADPASSMLLSQEGGPSAVSTQADMVDISPEEPRSEPPPSQEQPSFQSMQAQPSQQSARVDSDDEEVVGESSIVEGISANQPDLSSSSATISSQDTSVDSFRKKPSSTTPEVAFDHAAYLQRLTALCRTVAERFHIDFSTVRDVCRGFVMGQPGVLTVEECETFLNAHYSN
jgi:hypothetical protein